MSSWLKAATGFVLLVGLSSNVCYAQRATSNSTTGYFREFALDHSASGPAIVKVDPEDNVWIALARSGKLACFRNGRLDTYEIGADSRPVGLEIGTVENGFPGKVWIAASFDNKILSFDKLTGKIVRYDLGDGPRWPFNVSIGPNRKIWFSQRAAGKIGCLDPDTGKTIDFDLPTPNCGPAGLDVDWKSGLVWYSAGYRDRIGCLEPTTGEVKEYIMGETSTGLESGPAGLVVDSKSGVWFAKLEGKLGHIQHGSDTVELIQVPLTALRPAGIEVDHDGNIWALALDGNVLLRYSPATKQFAEYPIPTGYPDREPRLPPYSGTSRPFGIGIDSQGNVWFSEQYAGQLGVLDVAPPTLTVYSPSQKVTTARTLFTFRAEDRVSDAWVTQLLIDGIAWNCEQNLLDVSNLVPGPHTLTVVVSDRAGHSARSDVRFEYCPSPHALVQILDDAVVTCSEGEAARNELIGTVRKLGTLPREEVIPELRDLVATRQSYFQSFPLRPFINAVDFLSSEGRPTINIEILDDPPYFAPSDVVVKVGHQVRWWYAPAAHGHEMSHALHRVELKECAVSSNLLRHGESFAYRFDKPGVVTFTNARQVGATGILRIQSP